MGNNFGNELLTNLVLRLQAHHLPRCGVRMTLPDTYAVVTSVSDDKEEHVLGRTEVIPSSCQPQWITTIPFMYELGSTCVIRIRLFRVCSNGEDNDENLGCSVFEVGNIWDSRNRAKVRRLPQGGVILCRLEQNNSIHQDRTFRFQFAAELDVERSRHRPLPRFATAPDTIIEISKQHPSSKGWVPIYRSSPVEHSWMPKWDEGQIDLDSLCNGDKNQPLQVAVIQHRKKGQNQVLAECETTLAMILHTQLDTHSTPSTPLETKTIGFPLYDPISRQRVVGRLQVILAKETRFPDGARRFYQRDAHHCLVQSHTSCSSEKIQTNVSICADLDQCQECVQVLNPSRHEPVHPTTAPCLVAGPPITFQRSIELHMTQLLHATTCTLPKCPSANCTKMKELLTHGEQCQRTATEGCHVCQRVSDLLQIHARECKATSCPVPNCMAIRELAHTGEATRDYGRLSSS